jgi:hypothetical protein
MRGGPAEVTGPDGEITMQTMLLAAAVLSLAVVGSAFAGADSGPNFPAYDASDIQLWSQMVFGAGVTFAGSEIGVLSNVVETGSPYGPQVTGQAAQTPDTTSGLVGSLRPTSTTA